MPETEKRQRRSIRLTGYDYSQEGAYFVTVCSHNRETIFDDKRVRQIVAKYWFGLPRHYAHAELDEFVIMPNHIHGIVVLVGAGSAGRDLSRTDKPVLFQSRAPSQPHRAGLPVLRTAELAPTDAIKKEKRHSLAEVVRFFKTYSAREINRLRHTPGLPVWQRNYYENIIRNEAALNKIREYIITNPTHWELDIENPDRRAKPGSGNL